MDPQMFGFVTKRRQIPNMLSVDGGNDFKKLLATDSQRQLDKI